MPKLSKRLLFAAQELGTVNTIADIGTDHGKLILYALENGIAERAFAVDISEKSLQKARNIIAERGLENKVDFFCGDGMRPLKEMPDVVVIAGMGGHETVKILSEGKPVKKAVLVPHQDAHLVRRYLVDNGYCLVKDYVIFDGKYYAIIVAEPGKSRYTDEEILLGKNNPKTEDFSERIVDRVQKIERIMADQHVGIESLQEDIRTEYEVMKKMVTIADVIKAIEDFAPLSLQGDFDNCGLKIGNTDRPVTGVLVTVDTNASVVAEAKKKNCNLILEHHPSIFRPIRSIDEKIPLNAALLSAAKEEIAVYSAHTNVDFTVGGLNDTVAKDIGLEEIVCLSDPSGARVGKLKTPCSLKEYARRISELFDDDNVSVVGDWERIIQKVGVINGGGGSGEDAVWDTFNAGCDVFVTGDVKHNVARLAKELKYAIIQVGHFSSERAFMPLMKKVIQNAMPNVDVYCAESIGSPFNRRGEIWK